MECVKGEGPSDGTEEGYQRIWGKYPEMSYEVMARIEGDRILEVILWN